MNPNIKKYLIYSLGFLLAAAYIFLESQNRGDLTIYLNASRDLFKGDDIFVNTYFDGYHYFYSVLFAILVYPLSFLPMWLYNSLWITLNIFLVYRIFLIIKNLLPLHDFSKKHLMFLRVCGFLFALRFIHENIHAMQITIIIMYLALQGLQFVFANKYISGGALIALGINIKLLPIVLVPYLLYRGFFKGAIFTIAFYFLYMFIPAVVIGWDHNQQLLATWGHLINPLNSNHVLDTEERSFHGLSTLLSTLLVKNVPDKHALTIPRNIADISIEHLNLILNIVRLILIAFTLYFLRSAPFKKPVTFYQRFREVSYILILIPLIFPHQQHYAFLFVCPAFVFCIHYLIRNRNELKTNFKKTTSFMLVLIYLICNLKLLLGEFNEYYEHFKILTYAAILLVIVLAFCEPKEKESVNATA